MRTQHPWQGPSTRQRQRVISPNPLHTTALHSAGMLERAQTRALPLLNKSVELTPALSACCGACRTCMTTNIITVATAALSEGALWLGRLARRANFAKPRKYPGLLLGRISPRSRG